MAHEYMCHGFWGPNEELVSSSFENFFRKKEEIPFVCIKIGGPSQFDSLEEGKQTSLRSTYSLKF